MPPAPSDPTISNRPMRCPTERVMAGIGGIIAARSRSLPRRRFSEGGPAIDTMPAVVYRFGRFVLDYDTRQILADGGEIHLSPKAFELLALLLANRPRAVSKTELQERLWPSTFVEETNLAGLVAEIRRALDDSATEPVFVRTVYRFGYRFVGDAVETS